MNPDVAKVMAKEAAQTFAVLTVVALVLFVLLLVTQFVGSSIGAFFGLSVPQESRYFLDIGLGIITYFAVVLPVVGLHAWYRSAKRRVGNDD